MRASFFLLLLGIVAVFLSPQVTFACAIIEGDGDTQHEEPIEDCGNPFGFDEVNENLSLFIDEEEVVPDAQYDILGTSVLLSNDSNAFTTFVLITKHDADNYLVKKEFFGKVGNYTFPEAGTYTVAVFEEDQPVIVDVSWTQRLKQFFVPTVYAQSVPGSLTKGRAFTFEVTEVVEPLNPLIQKYAPVLYFHPEENYFPMNVEAFVEASALWDSTFVDEIVSERGATTIETLVENNGDDKYLAFSSDEPGTFNTEVALERYQDLVESGEATTTYYAYVMEDEFTDDEGNVNEFTVIQYWYFYAMNDWQDHGGRNNHEGDWESVFVFLDRETQAPLYIAFSAHHNDGDPQLLQGQYGNVRRSWNENDVSKFRGSNLLSYVSLGSHALYPHPGVNNQHDVFGVPDIVSNEGAQLFPNVWSETISFDDIEPIWVLFNGKWGSDLSSDIKNGNSGPQGPRFSDVSGIVRFENPIEWAGIDQISTREINELTNFVTYPNQQVTMTFSQNLPLGTTLSTDMRDEIINFGNNVSEHIFLPHYWVFETDMENGTFDVSVTIRYNSEEFPEVDLSGNQLSVFFFNETTNEWEEVVSDVNTSESIISFSVNHFSRYALGFKKETELSVEELFDQLRADIDETDLRRYQKKLLTRIIDRAERRYERSIKVSSLKRSARYLKLSLKSLEFTERVLVRYEKRGRISQEELVELTEILSNIRSLIR